MYKRHYMIIFILLANLLSAVLMMCIFSSGSMGSRIPAPSVMISCADNEPAVTEKADRENLEYFRNSELWSGASYEKRCECILSAARIVCTEKLECGKLPEITVEPVDERDDGIVCCGYYLPASEKIVINRDLVEEDDSGREIFRTVSHELHHHYMAELFYGNSPEIPYELRYAVPSDAISEELSTDDTKLEYGTYRQRYVEILARGFAEEITEIYIGGDTE